MSDDFTQRLEILLGADYLLTGTAAKDALPEGAAEEAWIALPGSGAEVSEIVALASARRVSIVPIGGGSRPPRTRARRCLYIDCRRMNHVLHLDETSMIVHIQAGLSALSLEQILAPRGLSLGDYPPQAMASTIGGLLSVRTPGKSSRRHGFIEEAVLGLSAVLPDGRSIHTKVAPKRATGPDLNRALCGSEGTLGIITSAVLRIHRRPENRFFGAHKLPDMAAAIRAVRLLLREEAQPSAMRLYNAATARAHLGKDVCDDGEAVLLVATAGPTDLAACDRNLAQSAAEAEGGTPLPEGFAHTWWTWRTGGESTMKPRVPNLQVSATPSKQLAVYEAIEQAGGDDLHCYLSRFDLDGAILFCAVDETRVPDIESAAGDAGGYLLGRPDKYMEPYYKELKKQLDPHGLMNPGI